MNTIVKLSLASILSAGLFTGCGSSSNSDDSPTKGEAVGYFIDAAVKGAHYKTTSGLEGDTDEFGRFSYNVGDEVELSLGKLLLGKTKPGTDGKVTPQTLISDNLAPDANQTESITLLLQMLQSLDSDGNTSNGIDINDTVASKFGKLGHRIDFHKDVNESYLIDLDHNLSLGMDKDHDKHLDVNKTQAREHFRNSEEKFDNGHKPDENENRQKTDRDIAKKKQESDRDATNKKQESDRDATNKKQESDLDATNKKQESDLDATNKKQESDLDATNAPTQDNAVVGYFIDAAVKGAHYKTTSGLEGDTDEFGRFSYNVGDEVELFLGKISLGKAQPETDGKVTPQTLISDNLVPDANQTESITLLLQMLQSLDSDGNTSNGIDINDTVVSKFNKLKHRIDFHRDVNESYLIDLDHNLSLGMDKDHDKCLDVNRAQAREHFRKSRKKFYDGHKPDENEHGYEKEGHGNVNEHGNRKNRQEKRK